MNNDMLNYKKSSMYEVLMKRAYRTIERNLAKGIDVSVYRHLYFIPNGYSITEKSYEKQLEKIKGFLLKAIDQFLTFRLVIEEEMEVMQAKKIITQSYDEEVIYGCIESLLDATQRFK